MQDSSHYRKEAQKFIEQANSAKSTEHRLILLQKAQAMIRLAEQAEAMQRLVQDQQPPGDKPLSAS
jgi:hypothetical protein